MIRRRGCINQKAVGFGGRTPWTPVLDWTTNIPVPVLSDQPETSQSPLTEIDAGTGKGCFVLRELSGVCFPYTRGHVRSTFFVIRNKKKCLLLVWMMDHDWKINNRARGPTMIDQLPISWP